MAETTVVVTGANSYLGSRAVAALKKEQHIDVHAFVSPRWDDNVDGASVLCGVDCTAVDLSGPLPEGAKELIAKADRLFHFAWSRGSCFDDVVNVNEFMVRELMEPLHRPSNFVFISSVAGCPGALSTYGKAKAEATRFVTQRGGCSLVCGLVVDEDPGGPFKMLTSAVRKLPLRIRFAGKGTQVFPVYMDDVAAAVIAACGTDVEPGVYRLFNEPVDFNRFMAMLEEVYQKKRLPFPMSASLVLNTTRALKALHIAPQGLCDKILTFLYKDAAYLGSLNKIPGFSMREVNRELLERR